MGGVVTEDGAETDLDLGHYERFTDTSMSLGLTMSPPADLPSGDK